MKGLISVDKRVIIDVMTNGLGFKRRRIPSIGEVVALSAREAFSYTVISSSGYLDPDEPDLMFRLTRDYYRIFNQAEQFELQQGVFSLSDLRFVATVNTNANKKPYIALNEKYLLPVEYERHSELIQILNELTRIIKEQNLDPGDFIITPIRRTGKKSSEIEPFFEYVISRFFNDKGYVTDTQIPFYYGIGTPDVTAYQISSIAEILRRVGYIRKGGSPIDIMGASVFGFNDSEKIIRKKVDTIVFEVKTGSLAAPQIKKYTRTGIFNKAYEVIPVLKNPEKYAGLITINGDGKLKIFESVDPIPFDEKKQKKYLDWVEVYLKYYVLANLTNQELEDLISENSLTMCKSDILHFITSCDLNLLSIEIRSIIERRKENCQRQMTA